MMLSELAGLRIVRSAAIAGAVALSVAACARDMRSGPGEEADRIAELSEDAIERMVVESERKAAVARELAGRAPARSAIRPDASISATVESAVFAVPSLQVTNIHVRTRERVVTLNGTAGTPQDRSKAAQAAVSVPGVRSVRNDILVAEGP